MTVTRSNGSSADYFRTKVGDDEDVFWHGRTGAKSPSDAHSDESARMTGHRAMHPHTNVKDRE